MAQSVETVTVAAAAMTPGGWIAVALAAVALVLLVRAFIEPARLDSHTVRLSLPSAGQGLRILFFSDLHAEHLRIRTEVLLDACAAACPDLILFAGDLADGDRHLDRAVSLLRQLRGLPGLSQVPFLAVRGNHDTPQGVRQLESAGIEVLTDESRVLTIKGQAWQIIGLDDLRSGRHDPAAVLIKAERDGVPPERRLIVAHNPDTLLALPPRCAALFLAGHFHGGQIWLPFHLEFLLLRREKLPRRGIHRGQFTWQGTAGYISRGLGCVLMPLRLFSRPELTLLEISPAADSGLSQE